MSYPSHGANPSTLYQQLHIKQPLNVFDLSENVNALGTPVSLKETWTNAFDEISGYPHELAEPFRSEVAKKHNVSPEHFVVGNGAAELLMAIAQLFRGKNAIVMEPSFSEYKRTLHQQKIHIESIIVEDLCSYQLPIEKIKKAMLQADIFYLCNPNNPTGVCLNREIIQKCIEYGREANCAIVIDEAFMDFTDETNSVIDLVETYEHLFVLRSMTKMFGLAGVRLGYLISQQASAIRNVLPHWNVSQIAILLGCQCLKEDDFVIKSKQYSDHARKKIKTFLVNHHCTVTESAVNFITFQPPWPTEPFYLYLLKEGIVTRHTKNFVGLEGNWLRIGMKDETMLNKFMSGFLQYENIFNSTRSNRME